MRESLHCKKIFLKQSLLYTSIALATALPGAVFAQNTAAAAAADEEEVEEVVVTGTYIRNSAFATASPVDTIDQDALMTAACSTISM